MCCTMAQVSEVSKGYGIHDTGSGPAVVLNPMGQDPLEGHISAILHNMFTLEFIKAAKL